MRPALDRVCRDDVCVWTDPGLRERSGILIAFTERTGGVSRSPYASLNLAYHTGDEPADVDRNRDLLMETLDLLSLRSALVTAEQVHGAAVAVVDTGDAGAGAHAPGAGPPAVAGVDALVTRDPAVPLALFFADCVPVTLVAESSGRGVAVAHAGWRGAAAGVHTAALGRLCESVGCGPEEVAVYIGPSIGACHYEVGPEVTSHFVTDSDTISTAPGRLDLASVVSADLERTGVRRERILTLARCTAEYTECFFSYRTEGVTGRHAALAAVLGGGR